MKLSPVSFIRTGANTKLIHQLAEFGQNLKAVGPNELAIANIIALVISELETKPAPEAYMGYALYDVDSNRYEVGKVVLSKKARNKHEELIQKIPVKKDGYIETFLVNETSENVWFDQFRIQSTGPLIVQETHYDAWGLEIKELGYQYGGIKENPYLYQGKEFIDGLNLNIYDFHARGYDPVIGRTWQVDPMADSYYPWSPYAWVMNNPIKYMDPTGMFSTHTDEDGNVVAVYDDGDLGVYRHEGSVSKKDIDKRHNADNPSGGGQKMGETLAWWSFANPKDGNSSGSGLGRIDFGSYNARDWLNSTEPGGLLDYVTNAGTGADEKYDYKSQGLAPNASTDEIENFRYRGSQIATGVYASARDVGNIFAGMYGSLFGTSKHSVMKAMGAFNANENRLDGGLVGELFTNWNAPYGEDYRSHYMQSVGFDIGRSSKSFKKKFGVR